MAKAVHENMFGWLNIYFLSDFMATQMVNLMVALRIVLSMKFLFLLLKNNLESYEIEECYCYNFFSSLNLLKELDPT